jgi:MscS family membrane protein
MKLLQLLGVLTGLVLFALPSAAQETAAATTTTTTTTTGATAEETAKANAAAAVASGHAEPHTPQFLEDLVDALLEAFDVRSSGNTAARYGIALLILLIAVILRRVVTTFVFSLVGRLARRTNTTLDDKLLAALEAPLKALILVLGVVAAFKVLKFSPSADRTLAYAYTVAFSLVIFWGFLKAFNALLDHAQEIARDRNLGITPFMPWIRKTLLVIVFIFGVLMIAQSLGANVKAFLAGLGIGGLAFALAAQDTLANVFGSVVVAVDQPFRIGETVRIGNFVGGVEDIGLRSTRLRAIDKSLIIIPNKTVAAEGITNLSRFTRRRNEQVIGLTYDTKASQMEELVGAIRELLTGEKEIDPKSVNVFFRDFNASSLDIWITYESTDADFAKHMRLKQRLNLTLMRMVEERGLEFAFPTQTLHVASLLKTAEPESQK